MPARIYLDRDGDLKVLRGKICAVLGFGAQGRAHALNLNESGLQVIVGLRPKSRSRAIARKAGLEAASIPGAVRGADVIFLALPDTEMPAIYQSEIAGHLRPGQTFSSRTGSRFSIAPSFP